MPREQGRGNESRRWGGDGGLNDPVRQRSGLDGMMEAGDLEGNAATRKVQNAGEGSKHAVAAGAAAHRELQQKELTPIREPKTRREQIGEAALTAENRHTWIWMQAGREGRRVAEQKFAPGRCPCHFRLRGSHTFARAKAKDGGTEQWDKNPASF